MWARIAPTRWTTRIIRKRWDELSRPAKPSPEAIGTSELVQRIFPSLDPLLEIELSVFTQLLAIELSARSRA